MFISEVLDHLTATVLSQHKYGGYSKGGMEDEYIPKVVAVLNQGIRDINSYIDICKDSMIIGLDTGRTDYRMNTLYAKSNISSSVGVDGRFILDAVSHPFNYDFRKFLSIAPLNNIPNDVFELNHRTHNNSISIISFDMFRVAYPTTGQKVMVEYSHAPRGITSTTMAEALVEVFTLPTDILAALYAYVESKMTAGVSIQEDIGDDTASYSLYMREIEKLKEYQFIASDMYINDNFKLGGWR